jgi:hypothetical protein
MNCGLNVKEGEFPQVYGYLTSMSNLPILKISPIKTLLFTEKLLKDG